MLTAKDPGQTGECTQPSPKKSKLSHDHEARDTTKHPVTLEKEFKALRDEYSKHRLDEMVENQKLTTEQRGFLRKPVHGDMTRSEVFFGNKHHELAEVVSNVGFEKKTQNLRIVGIVQPFGVGKTKTALMLSHDFVLLPIRWTLNLIHPLMSRLEEEQDKLFGEIKDKEKTGVTDSDVLEFSDRCLRLVELALLSVAATFSECVDKSNDADKSWFNAKSERDRLQFAILAVSSGSAVVSEMTKWFEEHLKTTEKKLEFNTLRKKILTQLEEQSGGRRVVFVMDEIHRLVGRCLGYALHDNYAIGLTGSELVEHWKAAVHNSALTEKHTRTDLFYQLCSVMFLWLGVEAAFVTCSSMYDTWTKIDEMSPKSRGILRRFTDTHWLSENDCKKFVQHYFAVGNHLDELDLCMLSRPVFACDFILQLNANLGHLTSTPCDVAGWVEVSYKQTLKKSLLRLCSYGKTALQKDSTRSCMNNVVTNIRVSAGILEKCRNSSFSDEQVELVKLGLLRFERCADDPDLVEVCDPLAERAILQCYLESTERTVVLESVALELHTGVRKAREGFVFEQALGYLAVKGLIKVPTYESESSRVTFECLQSTAEFAALYEDLRMKSDSPTLLSEASFVIDLLSARQLPELNCVLLPTKSCKPSVLFRANKVIKGVKGSAVNVVIQSKIEDRVLGYADFLLALASLDPTNMFSHAAETEKATWQERHHGVLHGVQFMRIVFAALGFSEEVQHTVHEYNLRQANPAHHAKPSFIHLLDLDYLQESLGCELYAKVKALVPSHYVKPNLIVLNKMPDYATAWHEADQSMSKLELEDLCRSWGIVHSKKTEAQLITALNTHQKTLETCFKELHSSVL